MLATIPRAMRVAVEGCSHGCLDQIYSSVRALDKRDKKQTDLLILCGDVQTVRNAADMDCLAVPNKYKQLGDFHRYYSGKRKAPILTLMIGGNHEASNYLYELYYGGWVAPNIYYLGAAGCVEVGGLTIAGISGIYKSHDFTLGRHERMPYSGSAVRSIYHTRCYDTFRLHMLNRVPRRTPPTITVSHDWPNTIERHGDVEWLKRKKPFFKAEIESQSLGSPPLMDLLRDLKPDYWFSAHLHVRFAAEVKHDDQPTVLEEVRADEEDDIMDIEAAAKEVQQQLKSSGDNPDEITIDDDEFDDTTKTAPANVVESKTSEAASSASSAPAKSAEATRFLALSKCLAGHDFMQILTIPAPFDKNKAYRRSAGKGSDDAEQPSLRYSADWLAVLRATQPLLSLERTQMPLPMLDDAVMSNTLGREREWVQANLMGNADSKSNRHPLDIHQTQKFVQTAVSTSNPLLGNVPGPPAWFTNPQTEALCRLLDIPNRINPPPSAPPTFVGAPVGPRPPQLPLVSEEEEIRRIEWAAQAAMRRKLGDVDRQNSDAAPAPAEAATSGEEILVTLSDDEEDEQAARWKEGTG